MQKFPSLFALLGAIMLMCSGASERQMRVRAEEAASPPRAANVALLVGINAYPNLEQRYQLHGCENDVKMMKNLLLEVFGFEENEIRTLTNEEATRQNILKQFENFLIRRARTEGQAVFFFSGHGAQMTDLNNDEADGWDETIVPHDSRDPQGRVVDIPDDTLGVLLAKLTQRCPNATVILDCCQSGSGVRGLAAIPKQLDRLALAQNPTAGPKIEDGPSGILPPNPDYVLVAACLDREFAYEYQGQGALTQALNKVLRGSPDATYREAMYKINDEVASYKHAQHPQLEGARRDAKLFGNLGVVERFVEVMEVQTQRVKLNAGKAHGVTEGSQYALFKPGTTSRKKVENYLAKVEITKVEDFFSWAGITERNARDLKNAAAFETSHHFGGMQIAVRLDLGEARELENSINTVLQEYKEKQDLVNLVSATAAYDLKVSLSPDKKRLVLERPNLARVQTLATHPDTIKYVLTDILTKEARYNNLFKLENRSDLKVQIKLERWERFDENNIPINKLDLAETAGGQRYFVVGNAMQPTVVNLSDKPVHIYFLDLGTDGSVSLIFPEHGGADSPLPPGDSLTTFPFRVTPPAGLNALKLIATTAATDFSVLTQQGFRSIEHDTTASRGLDYPLGKLLNLAWGGKRNLTRVKPVALEDWVTEKISFLIREEND